MSTDTPSSGSYPVPATDKSGPVVASAIRWGWHVFKVNAKPMIISSIIIVLIAVTLNVGGQLLDYGGRRHHRELVWFMLASAVLSIVNNLFSMFIQAGVIRITLWDLATDRGIQQTSLFTKERYWHYVLTTLIVTAGTAIGLVLFFIPGIVWFTFTIFYGWFVIDKQMGPFQAIGASIRLVGTRVGLCFLFILTFFGMYLLGFILLGIGMIVTVPVTQFALGYMYKYLQGDPITYEPVPPTRAEVDS